MPDPPEEFQTIVKKTKQMLKRMERAGMRSIPVRPRARRFSAADSHSVRSKADRLRPVEERALRCQKCRLSKSRTHVVFGEGSLDANLVFVGEGPGRSEDLQGRPFVGAAGKLLTKIIEAMKLTREEVYILNVVKCRPPMNRPPQPDEAEACREYLSAQLETIRPKVICALGRTAANALLETDAPMKNLRGKFLEYNGVPLMVTFHPAYLLRNPSAKADLWADMQLILERIKHATA